MSVKFKEDLGLKDYLDIIAKQNDAIIDQLMVDKDIMTTTFRKANYNQYKESIKAYTVAGKVETPKIEEKWDGGTKVEAKSNNDDNTGIIIIVVVATLVLIVWLLGMNGII